MDMITAEEYLDTRLSTQKAYFSGKATKNKRRYYICAISKLITSLGISIISLITGDCSASSIIIACLSAIVALMEGILLLCKYCENWVIYRITNEKLKREEMLFRTGTGMYWKNSPEEAFNTFVQNVEAIIQISNNRWEHTYKSQKGDS